MTKNSILLDDVTCDRGFHEDDDECVSNNDWCNDYNEVTQNCEECSFWVWEVEDVNQGNYCATHWWAVFLIILAILLGVALCCGLCAWLYMKNKRKNAYQHMEEAHHDSYNRPKSSKSSSSSKKKSSSSSSSSSKMKKRKEVVVQRGNPYGGNSYSNTYYAGDQSRAYDIGDQSANYKQGYYVDNKYANSAYSDYGMYGKYGKYGRGY